MKSILFASTALVAFAGAAAAQGVTLTGNAEMGIFGNDDADTQFFTDIDVTFTMSGETDNGLTFGASIDLDESDGGSISSSVERTPGPDGTLGTEDDGFVVTNDGSGGSGAFAPQTQGGETIFLSGGFGTITMGDTDGALDWALTEVAFNSGSLNDDETEHAGYNGNAGHDGSLGLSDGQILRYDYSFGDFGVAFSAEQLPGIGDDAGDDYVLGLGFKYGLDLGGTNIDFGLGYQDSDIADVLGLSVSGSFGNGFTAGLSYMDFDGDEDDGVGDFEHFGVGVGYTSGAISVSANYGEYDRDDANDSSGFGLSAGYDLGGGAIVQFGYGYSDFDDDIDLFGDDDDDDFSTYSFGVRMNF